MNRAAWVGLATAAAGLVLQGEAAACGGCFHPVTANAVVTGHRMAFAISSSRTVLWDQIQYSGAPSEFGWVLPITPGATIEPSSDAWFETLDATTAVQVTSPPLACASSGGGGIGCGSSSDMGAKAASGPTLGSVTVIHEGTVGPYETVTLRSTDAGSLRTWLSSHGYVIPTDIDPIIDAYIGEGADFIALRLIPGTGVNKMTPVRVATPSGKAILPLRMVQAGTGSTVDIVLFVIAESRKGLSDLTEVFVDPKALSFDFQSSTSNYLALRDRALGENSGVSFLTAYAAARPFAPASAPIFYGNGNVASSLAELYFDQAEQQGAGVPCTRYTAALGSAGLVSDGSGPGTVLASDLNAGCSTDLTVPGSDLAAALIGMHPSSTWLSRLEMRLPREALTMDCHVADDAQQTPVSNQLQASKMTNPPCEPPIFQSRVAKRPTTFGSTATWALGLLAALGLARRLRRPRA